MDRREVNRKWYHSFDEKRMVFILELEDKDMEIPAKYEVCETCDGKGSHVNPGVDSQGLSQEDFDEDPDFRENYFSGMYNVPCNECHGKRVSPVLNTEIMNPEDKRFVEDWIQDHYDYQAECAMERRMGC